MLYATCGLLWQLQFPWAYRTRMVACYPCQLAPTFAYLDLLWYFPTVTEGFRCRRFKSRLCHCPQSRTFVPCFFYTVYTVVFLYSANLCELGASLCVGTWRLWRIRDDLRGLPTDLYAAFLSYCAHPHASHIYVSCLFKYTVQWLLVFLLIGRYTYGTSIRLCGVPVGECGAPLQHVEDEVWGRSFQRSRELGQPPGHLPSPAISSRIHGSLTGRVKASLQWS
jgi:hypothetical protein